MMKRFLATIATLVMAGVMALGFATVATAHSDTFQSVPANDAVVNTPVTELQFTFVEAVQQDFSPEVVLMDAAGTSVELGIPRFDVTGATMTVEIVGGALPNGLYTSSYRIVSVDGHPASGEISFTVEGSTDSAVIEPAPEASEAIVDLEAEELIAYNAVSADNSQMQLALGLTSAAAVALVAALVIVAIRRKRNSENK
jgi:methionine-rich copper-binding protein CopC